MIVLLFLLLSFIVFISFYDLSKYYTLILKEAKRAKGKNEKKSEEMRETKE